MNNAILSLAPYQRRRLSEGLRDGSVGLTKVSLERILGAATEVHAVLEDLRELEQLGVVGPGAAAWIEAVEEAIDSRPRADLVWSGEEVHGLHARDTRAVYEELLGKSEESLWISSYAYYDGRRAFQVLAEHMDRNPDLKTTLLLNIGRRRGDTTKADHLVRKFADRLWEEWPGTTRPRVFYDPRSLDPDGEPAVLHAKAVVADLETLFITSANLTESAFDRNIEMGLLVRDRALGLSAVRHFQALIQRGLVRALPD